jgi:hypothetical protein
MAKQSVLKIYQDKAEQVATATNLLVQKTRDWQVIKQYINNRIPELKTDLQKEKLKRYQYIYDQLSSGRYTEREIVDQLKRLFNVRLAQAYEDLNCTRELFVTTLNINKRFELKLELESAKEMKRKCVEERDYKNAALYSKIITGLLSLIEDEEPNTAELFEGIKIEATFNPELLGAPPISKNDMRELMQSINAKRSKKINLDFIEDIEYESA